jgi:hypothetical protein
VGARWQGGIFLELLEPYILTDRLTRLNPAIMQVRCAAHAPCSRNRPRAASTLAHRAESPAPRAEICVLWSVTPLTYAEVLPAHAAVAYGTGGVAGMPRPARARIRAINGIQWQLFVEHYQHRHLLRRIEQCFMHIEIASLDLHQALAHTPHTPHLDPPYTHPSAYPTACHAHAHAILRSVQCECTVDEAHSGTNE